MVPDNKQNKRPCDAYSMIRSAKSLQRLVKDLELNVKAPISDSLLFEGKFIAAPVLLALAVEIALKALQCRERKGKPDHHHDLLKLFDSLEKATQERLEAEIPEVPYPIPELLKLDFIPFYSGIRDTLKFHKDVFKNWRYIYENLGQKIHTGQLDRALNAIIKVYDETMDKSY